MQEERIQNTITYKDLADIHSSIEKKTPGSCKNYLNNPNVMFGQCIFENTKRFEF
jgi:hypothetical protein